MNLSIEKEKLLIVEGQDEVSVFGTLLDIHGVNDIQIIECGGNIKLAKTFPALIKSSGFIDVKSYAIIQDADTNYNATFQRIQHLLKSHHQPVPTAAEVFIEKNDLRVGTYILPGAGSAGMLEDLYLYTLDKTPVLESVDLCVKDLQAKCPATATKGTFSVPANLAKVRALGTLMATSGPHNRLGHAAKDGYWDLRHAAMDSLTKFILQL